MLEGKVVIKTNEDFINRLTRPDRNWLQMAMRSRVGRPSVRAGKVGTKAPEPAPPSLYLPGSHGTGWSPDYSHAAILCRSRQVTGMFVPGADTMERILERWPLGA